MNEPILYSSREGIAQILFNRPDKKNAITSQMYTAMVEGLAKAEQDPLIRVVVIAAEGSAFTAGNDLSDFLNHPPVTGDPPVFRFLQAISTATKPIIAAVNGSAIGIGTTLLLHCDLVIASHAARFQLPFVNLGLVPEAASSLLLPRLIGYQRAAEMLLLGEAIDAETAFQYGIVNRLVDAEGLRTTALQIAASLAAKPPEAVRLTKQLLRCGPLDVAERIQAERELFARQLVSLEAREAFQAFFEKRPANFSSKTTA